MLLTLKQRMALLAGLSLTVVSGTWAQSTTPGTVTQTQVQTQPPQDSRNATVSLNSDGKARPDEASNPEKNVSNPNNNNDDKKNTANGYTLKGDAIPPTKARPLEDFNALTVPADLKFNVELMQKGEFPEFTKELQRAEWRWWDPIDLWIVKPAGVKHPPVILYLSTFPSNNDRYYDNEYCKFLTKNGFAAVGFASALTGPRYHDRPMKEWFISDLPEALSTTVHDVQFILNYLNQRGDLDMSRVGMVGDGSGASIAIMAAAVDSRIRVLDLVDPWGDWPNWLARSPIIPEDERATYLKPEFLKKLDNVDTIKWLPKVKTQRVRLMTVEDVTITPAEVRNRLQAAAPPNVQVVNYRNAKQFATEVTSGARAFDWIKEQLQPDASARAASPKSTP